MADRFVPTLDRPPLQVDAIAGVIDPLERTWRVLAVCVLMARTHRAAAEPVVAALFDRWPRSTLMLSYLSGPHRPDELVGVLRPLGFQNRRARLLRDLGFELWAQAPAVVAGLDPLDVVALPGCGAYAADAYALFLLDDVARDPADHVLAEWARLRREARPVDGPHGLRHTDGP